MRIGPQEEGREAVARRRFLHARPFLPQMPLRGSEVDEPGGRVEMRAIARLGDGVSDTLQPRHTRPGGTCRMLERIDRRNELAKEVGQDAEGAMAHHDREPEQPVLADPGLDGAGGAEPCAQQHRVAPARRMQHGVAGKQIVDRLAVYALLPHQEGGKAYDRLLAPDDDDRVLLGKVALETIAMRGVVIGLVERKHLVAIATPKAGHRHGAGFDRFRIVRQC